MKKLGWAVLVWSVLQGGAWAGFAEGLAAANRGDYGAAFREWKPLARAGDASAQYNLGVMYANGYGVPKSDVEAVKWYRLAADQGDANAQSNLGVMYANGQGVPKSDVEAMKWYRLAADQGHAVAQFNLGVRYANGRGVPKSDTEAVKWYRLAADQGIAEAQYNLGVMYDNGEGVPKSDVEAVKWYRRAADQGHAHAQSNLGVMYEYGVGVATVNKVIAYVLFNLAAVNPSNESNDSRNRDRIEQQLTPTQRRTAQAISLKLQQSKNFLRTLDEAVRQTAGK